MVEGCLTGPSHGIHSLFSMTDAIEKPPFTGNGIGTGGIMMKTLFAGLLGIAVVSTAIWSMTTPASALGGCGPNGHRDRWGHCVFGGQNEDYCIRKNGHPAVRMPDGTLRCI